MKNIIILSVFAFTICNGLFLRQLATVTVTGAKDITACMANPYSDTKKTQEFTITNEGKVKVADNQAYMKLVKIPENTETATTCTIAEGSETKMTCTFTTAPAAGTYKYKAAETKVDNEENTLSAYESAEFTLVSTLITPKATQTNITVDYSETEGPYNVTVAFESTLSATALPEITANNKKLNCTLKTDSTKEMTCQWGSKADLPVPEDKDEETYVVSFKNSCDKAEELALGITVEDSQSIITLSKIALFVVAALLL